METKTSKAQLSVWHWKEKAYEEVKHLPIMEQLQVIHERTKDTIEQINIKKRAKNRHRPAAG